MVSAGLALCLAGCSHDTTPPAAPAALPTPRAADLPACADLIPRLPDSLAGLARAELDGRATGYALWSSGSGSVSLQCGVDRPESLRQTSRLLDVDDISWYVERSGDTARYWAVNRRPYVVLGVSSAVRPDRVLAPLGRAVATLDVAAVEPAPG